MRDFRMTRSNQSIPELRRPLRSAVKNLAQSVVALMLCGGAAMAQGVADITDLILVTGQSNVQGSLTEYDPQLDASHPRIFAFTSQMDWEIADLRQAWDMNGWHPGNGSLNDPNRQPYNNLAMQFAKRVVEQDPNRVVGFIVASAPGEGIQHWDADGTFYPRIASKVLAALNAQGVKSQIDAVLWHQGETDWILQGSSDSDAVNPWPSYYPDKLNDLITRLRNENWFANGKPFICGETIAADLNTHLMALNDDGDAWTGCVEGAGLSSRDGIHFDAHGLRILGSRYADKYLQMTPRTPEAPPPLPTPIAIDDEFTADSGSTTTLNVLSNDELQIASVGISITAAPVHGEVTKNSDGTLSYRHNGDANEQDQFSYQIEDPLFGISNSATVTLQINPAGNYDAQRTAAMQNIVAALEAYKTQHGSYRVIGGGYRGNGSGWFHLRNGSSYPDSTANVLVDGGFLTTTDNADPLYGEPGAYSPFDFMLYRCKGRIGVFSKRDSAQSSADDLQWWNDNECNQSPISRYDHPYFLLAGTDHSETIVHDSVRATGVAQIIAALETYHANTGSYQVSGGGHRGNGNGWVQHAGGVYPDSVSNVLQRLGYLAADFARDPLYPTNGTFNNHDYMIYRCRNRVGVFSKRDTIQPKAEDLQWWTDNNCTQAPISRYDHPYFVLAKSADEVIGERDRQRADGVAQVIEALESYYADTGSYRVLGGGYKGNGSGWVEHAGGNYPDSVSNVLQSLGYLPDNYSRDPMYPSNGQFSSNDFMIYRCKNRVGIFSISDAIEPKSEDQDWWEINNCTSIPIARYQHTYFQLSAER